MPVRSTVHYVLSRLKRRRTETTCVYGADFVSILSRCLRPGVLCIRFSEDQDLKDRHNVSLEVFGK